MTAGEDVTSVRWVQVHKNGSGEVTIEHEHRDPLILSMNLVAARRLANRLLGSDNVEMSSPGDCFHWEGRSLISTISD
jgi:hypothetical protein